jgi:hypothetical protein
MKQIVIVYVCDNPACRKETPASNPLQGVSIPRVIAQAGSSKSIRKDIYACSAVCAGAAIQASLGVRVPKAKAAA